MRCKPGPCGFHRVAIGNAVDDDHRTSLARIDSKNPRFNTKYGCSLYVYYRLRSCFDSTEEFSTVGSWATYTVANFEFTNLTHSSAPGDWLVARVLRYPMPVRPRTRRCFDTVTKCDRPRYRVKSKQASRKKGCATIARYESNAFFRKILVGLAGLLRNPAPNGD